jgi:hypothetical protein
MQHCIDTGVSIQCCYDDIQSVDTGKLTPTQKNFCVVLKELFGKFTEARNSILIKDDATIIHNPPESKPLSSLDAIKSEIYSDNTVILDNNIHSYYYSALRSVLDAFGIFVEEIIDKQTAAKSKGFLKRIFSSKNIKFHDMEITRKDTYGQEKKVNPYATVCKREEPYVFVKNCVFEPLTFFYKIQAALKKIIYLLRQKESNENLKLQIFAMHDEFRAKISNIRDRKSKIIVYPGHDIKYEIPSQSSSK